MKQLALISLVFTLQLKAQKGVFSPGVYDVNVQNCFNGLLFKNVFYKDSIRRNDVMKGNTVWRLIGMNVLQNQKVFNTHDACYQIPLFEIIKFGIKEKRLNVFSSDEFGWATKVRLDSSAIWNRLYKVDTVTIAEYDEKGAGSNVTQIMKGFLMSSDIRTYLLKEEWVTNSGSGRVEKYIIGLAPVFYNSKTDQQEVLFWLYYPEWQDLLSSFTAPNYYSEEDITYHALLIKQFYSSRICKESNVFNRKIKSVFKGAEAIYQSNLIEEKFVKEESDLFQH